MWDLIVSVPDHCLSFYLELQPFSPNANRFLLVTDNRRSQLDSPFCVITQHRKFESSQTK